MAYVLEEERQKYYDKFPPGTKVFVLQKRQTWLRGTVIKRYFENGTVKICCQTEPGTEWMILYGDRAAILLAQGDPSSN